MINNDVIRILRDGILDLGNGKSIYIRNTSFRLNFDGPCEVEIAGYIIDTPTKKAERRKTLEVRRAQRQYFP